MKSTHHHLIGFAFNCDWRLFKSMQRSNPHHTPVPFAWSTFSRSSISFKFPEVKGMIPDMLSSTQMGPQGAIVKSLRELALDKDGFEELFSNNPSTNHMIHIASNDQAKWSKYSVEVLRSVCKAYDDQAKAGTKITPDSISTSKSYQNVFRTYYHDTVYVLGRLAAKNDCNISFVYEDDPLESDIFKAFTESNRLMVKARGQSSDRIDVVKVK